MEDYVLELKKLYNRINQKEMTLPPAESPWQNGLCEQNHAVVDRCLEKIMEDNPHAFKNGIIIGFKRKELTTNVVWFLIIPVSVWKKPEHSIRYD